MTLNLQIINPLNYPKWDELLCSNQEYSFFHTSNWARVLYESYHFNPLYFTLINEGKLLVSIPIMEIKSFLTGYRGTSLPFTDYCEPIITGDIHSHDIYEYLIKYGRQTGWKFIEIRGGSDISQELTPSSYYYGHTLNLLQNEEHILSNSSSNTKRNIKKAVKVGVEVHIKNNIESMNVFYKLNCITRKMHGLPPQPYYFLKKVYDHVISRNNGIIVSATYNGEIIASAVYFHLGRKAIYKYGASDKRYQQLRANNLVMWEAIKWYLRNGYESFCFGKTEPDNDGLRRFKVGWGAKERVINYYRYDLKRNVFINGESRVSGLHNKLFNKTPIPLLKFIGLILYKHVG
jgi:hypothetical protein